MTDVDMDAVRTETVARLVDLAIANVVRGTRVGMAVEDLVGASGANPALLSAATAAACRVAETSQSDQIEMAVVHLRAARRYLGGEEPAGAG